MSLETFSSIINPKISLFVIIILIVPLMPAVSYQLNHARKFSLYPHSFSDDVSSRKVGRPYKNFIWDNELVCTCSGKNLFAFERNGSIAWAVHLNYTCDPSITPVHGGSTKIFLVADNRVLKIYPLRIGTDEAPVELFFGPRQGEEGAGKIIGISASLPSSCVLINVQNRGLFAYGLYGQLIWSAGPVLYQHGYRQGCRRNITDCYFTSAPAIDHCESTIFLSNTVGELYSLSIRGHRFKWIRDLSSYGNAFVITPGNNGCLYVTIPDRTLVLGLDVSRGDILWRGSVGPLNSADSEPVVDSNGWISYSSLDGFLYSFSPEGDLKKFPASAGLDYVIQVDPVLDCSGYAVYISRTEMEGKTSRTTAKYSHVLALKPKSVAFTSLVPASGSVLGSESDPSKFLHQLSRSDLQHFLVDERALLAFFAVSRNGDRLACRTARQKLESSCSRVKLKSINIYTGNKKTIMWFLLMESIVLVLLAFITRFCCVFWKKKKLQGLNLGKFLEKRHSLRSQKRAFDRMITELQQRTSEEEQVMEKLGDLVKGREIIKRKLSTTYNLGRDGERSRNESLLPLHDERSRSFSFQGSMKESVTVSHTLSSDSDDLSSCSLMEDADDEDDGICGGDADAKGKARVGEEEERFSVDEISVKPLFLKHSFSEIEEDDDDVGNSQCESRSLRRRIVSFDDPVDEQQPSVRVMYSCLPRESKQKLEKLLEQWSQWHSNRCSSSDDSNVVLESGEETYLPALHVGLDKPSSIPPGRELLAAYPQGERPKI